MAQQFVLQKSGQIDAIRSTARNPVALSSSSPRIHNLMQRRSEFASQREFEIEASKDHWSELESNKLVAEQTDSDKASHFRILARRFRRTLSRLLRFCWHCASCGNVCNSGTHPGKKNSLECEDLEEPDEAEDTNREIFESIKKQSIGFRVFSGTLLLGPKIAEGGQAEIFELEGGINNDAQQLVVKAFKKGYSLRSLRGTPFLGNSAVIFAGTVLNDDRFAFVMYKYWGDLRKLIDLKMTTQNRHSQSPKPFHEDHAITIMLQMAKGMELLHKSNIVHKDLKASNVLITNSSEFSCVIADYECSSGVLGTGFWRAPEVLVAVRKHDTTTGMMFFTQKADVYSFAMTCYEVLTGCVPFEDLDPNDYEAVIRGLRPPLPHPMNSRVTELLCRCWHSNPHERPLFGEIVLALEMVKCGSDLSIGSHNSSNRSS